MKLLIMQFSPISCHFISLIILKKSEEMKTGRNLAVSSKESYDTKMAVLPVMMMMTKMI
jgi:hypothetical protein